jgi:histidinol-phosphate phosphatase family protein
MLELKALCNIFSVRIMQDKLETAVILAGGIGERLFPVTTHIPKALAPVRGEPILAKLIRQMEDIGMSRIFILTGYKSNLISDFVSGLKTNVQVICIPTEVNLSPSERLLSARNLIGDFFILLYCDNFVDEEVALSKNIKSESPISLLMQRRVIGNTMTNAAGDLIYSASSRSEEMPFVELGYIAIRTKLFFEALAQIKDLPSTIEFLSEKALIKGFEIEKDYDSVSSLTAFNKANKIRKKILIDRDGVLNLKPPHRTYLSAWHQFTIIPDNWIALSILAENGFDFIIATNQPGIALNSVEQNFLDALHTFITMEFLKMGVSIYSIYCCPHHWEQHCECRKPKPGMLNAAIKDFDLKSEQTIFIGDETKDAEAAFGAGIHSLTISDSHYPTLMSALSRIEETLNVTITR